MKTFKEYISEELLSEVLDSEFEVNHDKNLKGLINAGLKDKVYSGHTAVMSSDHMDKHGLKVLRLKNINHEVEYHLINSENALGSLPPEKQNTKALLHGLKIIKDDSKSYIERGNKIKLQSATGDQHENYKKLAKHIIKDHPDKSIKDVGETDRTDGQGLSKTLMIEAEGFNPIDWVEFLGLKK